MKELTAKDIMNPDVVSVSIDMTVHALAGFFTEKMISGAPVIDETNKLIGVVSTADIVRNDDRRTKIAHEKHDANYYLHGWEDELNADEMEDFHVEEDEDLTVSQIMTPLLFKVNEDQPISELADMMIKGRIHRLLVAHQEEVVGIITTLDMLNAIREYTKQI